MLLRRGSRTQEASCPDAALTRQSPVGVSLTQPRASLAPTATSQSAGAPEDARSLGSILHASASPSDPHSGEPSMRMPMLTPGFSGPTSLLYSVPAAGVSPDGCDCTRCKKVLGQKICWDDPQCLIDCHRKEIECAAAIASCVSCAAGPELPSCIACLGGSYDSCREFIH